MEDKIQMPFDMACNKFASDFLGIKELRVRSYNNQ